MEGRYDIGPVLFDHVLPPNIWAVAAIQIGGLFVTLLLNLYGLYLILSNRKLYRATSIQLLLLPMFSEVIKSGCTLTGVMVMIANRDSHAMRYAGCQLDGFSTFWGFALSGLSLINITIDRYMVVRGKTVTLKSFAVSSCCAIAISLALALGHLFVGNRYVPTPSRTYCMADFSSQDASDVALNAIACVLIVSGLGAVLYCQYVVQAYFQAAQNGVKLAQNSTILKMKNKNDAEDSHLLFWRFYGFSVVSMIAWFPYLVLIFSQVVSGAPASMELDAVASIFAVVAGIPLAVLHIMFTPLLRAEVTRRHDQAANV